jgi:hypothetical protein
VITRDYRVLVPSTQSSFQILAEAISARLPKSARRAVIHLPTQTFKVLRAINRLTDTLGKQVVREKKDAARQGLDIGTDLYGQLRAYSDVNGPYFGKAADRVQWNMAAPKRIHSQKKSSLPRLRFFSWQDRIRRYRFRFDAD